MKISEELKNENFKKIVLIDKDAKAEVKEIDVTKYHTLEHVVISVTLDPGSEKINQILEILNQ